MQFVLSEIKFILITYQNATKINNQQSSKICFNYIVAFQMALLVKNPPANAGDIREVGLIFPGKISWRRSWHPVPIFSPGESHELRSLLGYRP